MEGFRRWEYVAELTVGARVSGLGEISFGYFSCWAILLIAMKEHDFTEVVSLILKEDKRYDAAAYVYLRKALDYTIDQERKKQGKVLKRPRHVSGQELLLGIKDYSLDQFGPMTYTVLTSWGIKACEDFGEMVFNLIEYGVFSKNDQDSREDFKAIYTFEEVFKKPFEPTRKRLKRPTYRAIDTL